MNSILVTGGAGYAGITIVEELAKKYRDKKIIILDRNQRGCTELLSTLKNKYSNIDFNLPEKSDLRDSKNIEEAIKKYSPEIVVHLAAKVTDFSKNRVGKDEECLSTNYEASVNFAKLCKSSGVKLFIHQSTVSVYHPGENLKEDSPLLPNTAYGKSKLLGEQEILSLNDSSFNVIIFRTATIIGYNLNFKYETIINLICVRSVFKIPFQIFESALNNNKTYLSIEDNAKAIIFAIENSEFLKGEIFNLASFNANLEEVLQIVKSEIQEDFQYSILKEEKKNTQVYTINFDKIRKYGFNPEGELKGIIKDAIFKLKRVRDFYICQSQ